MLEVLITLSIVKSILIIGWFMHLKGETRVMKWVLMGSLCVCLCQAHSRVSQQAPDGFVAFIARLALYLPETATVTRVVEDPASAS